MDEFDASTPDRDPVSTWLRGNRVDLESRPTGGYGNGHVGGVSVAHRVGAHACTSHDYSHPHSYAPSHVVLVVQYLQNRNLYRHRRIQQWSPARPRCHPPGSSF